jgi:putative membrane protein
MSFQTFIDKEDREMKLVIRILINAGALWLTALLLPSIDLATNIWGILIVAIIFGLVNALIRPIIQLLALPITILTLGLFTLVINTLMLLITAGIAGDLLSIQGGALERLWYAFLGSIVISIISTLLSWILPD